MIPGKILAALLILAVAVARSSSAIGGDLQFQQLNQSDRAAFAGIVDAVDNLASDPDRMAKVQADIKSFNAVHPDFVPGQVEAARAEWLRISYGMGLTIGGKSFVPVFLDLQKRDPDYAKSYTLGARLFILSGDFVSAQPQLGKAAKLDPSDPWVDLTWELLFDRSGERGKALASARAAFAKAAGQPLPLAAAIVAIAKHGGITNDQSADALARAIYKAEGDASTSTAVVSKALDLYSFEPGLLQVLAMVMQNISTSSKPTPELQVQTARWYLAAGYMNDEAAANRYHPDYARAALQILDNIQDAPEVSTAVWNLRFAIAASSDDLSTMERLIEDGKKKGYSAKLIGQKTASLFYAQGKFRELIHLYRENSLPDDSVFAIANERTWNFEVARRYYLRQLEISPTTPGAVGDYAVFLLIRLGDADGAIEYAGKALALTPRANVRYIISLALLLKSGRFIRAGNLPEAKNAFEQARAMGVDPTYAKKSCYNFCDDVKAALAAFQ